MTKKEKLETADMIAKLYGRIKELEAMREVNHADIARQNKRIEELESKLKLADRNNELLRGHRDQLEAQQQNIDPEIAKVVRDNWNKLIDAQKPDDDIIPEDYYIK